MTDNELLQEILAVNKENLSVNQEILAEIKNMNSINSKRVDHVIKTSSQADKIMSEVITRIGKMGR